MNYTPLRHVHNYAGDGVVPLRHVHSHACDGVVWRSEDERNKTK